MNRDIIGVVYLPQKEQVREAGQVREPQDVHRRYLWSAILHVDRDTHKSQLLGPTTKI